MMSPQERWYRAECIAKGLKTSEDKEREKEREKHKGRDEFALRVFKQASRFPRFR